MKAIASLTLLLCFAGSALAQESVSPDRLGLWAPRDSNNCNTIYGDGRQLCLADRYHLQQDDRAREQLGSLQGAQEQNERLRSELLRRELAQTPAAAATNDSAAFASIPDFSGWHAANRWFGADRARTEYALLYARDLRLQQPNLTGRPFLNALSARVKEIFASGKR
jgi:hypothetical protein